MNQLFLLIAARNFCPCHCQPTPSIVLCSRSVFDPIVDLAFRWQRLVDSALGCRVSLFWPCGLIEDWLPIHIHVCNNCSSMVLQARFVFRSAAALVCYRGSQGGVGRHGAWQAVDQAPNAEGHCFCDF